MIRGEYSDNDDNDIYSCSVGYGFLATAVCLNRGYRDVGEAWQ